MCKFSANSCGSFSKSCREIRLPGGRNWSLYNVLGPGSLPGLAVFLTGNTPDHPVEARLLQLHCRDARKMCIKNIKIFIIKIFVFPSVDKSSLCCVQLISYLSSPRHVVPYRATCHLFSIILQAKASSCWITAKFYFNNLQRKVKEFQH